MLVSASKILDNVSNTAWSIFDSLKSRLKVSSRLRKSACKKLYFSLGKKN
jgi:hypothetical protein